MTMRYLSAHAGPFIPPERLPAPESHPEGRGWDVRGPTTPPPRTGAFAKRGRPAVRGKWIVVGGETFWVRGVTYGTFRPDAAGNEFHDRQKVERDLARISAQGLNAIRTYTVPPPWLLQAAHRHGLRVMVGIPWEQHVAFLDDARLPNVIEDRVRAAVAACAGHPAVLSYTIGSEIPASMVRWHGRRAVERFLERLYAAAKAEDPRGLVTYVNYPTTEYLDLPFLDVVCFNVYLESPDRLDAYLARLQNLAGEKPLVLGEVGLDTQRHGLTAQAADARVADPHGLRGGMRRRLRLRLDGRVAPRRIRRHRVGLWPHGPRPPAQAGPRGGARGFPGGSVLPSGGLASHLRRGVQLQRRPHHS
jgi:hypothetical protein